MGLHEAVSHRSRQPSLKPFIGRGAELRELCRLLDVARGHGSRVALVLGAAGVGKTRLVEEFGRVLATDVTPLAGGSVARADAVPFGPLSEALAPLVRARRPRALPPQQAAALDALIAPREEPLAAPTRKAVFEGLLDFLGDLEDPVVLVIDDVQWADPSTLELLTFLARNLSWQPVLLVLVGREPGWSATVDSAYAELVRSPLTTTIELRPFNRAELAALATARHGTHGTTADVDDLLERSGGNPFFAEQLLHSGPEQGALPSSVRAVVAHELSGVGMPGRRLVGLVLAGGGHVETSLAEHALGPEVAEAVGDAGMRNFVLQDGSGFRLRHSLYGEALTPLLGASNLRQSHEALAVAAESLQAELGGQVLAPAVLADHWLSAGRATRARPALRRAAAQAWSQQAYEEAYSLWRLLLDSLTPGEDPVLELEALNGAAQAAGRTRRVKEADDLLSAALRQGASGDPATLAVLHARRAIVRYRQGLTAEALWDARRGHDLLPGDSPVEIQAEVTAQLAKMLMMTGDLERARRTAENARELAVSARAPVLECSALTTLGTALKGLGEAAAAIEALGEGRHLAATYGDVEDELRVATAISGVLFDDLRFHECVAVTSEAVEVARRSGPGLSGWAASLVSNLPMELYMLGEWDLAEQQAQALESSSGQELEPLDRVHLAMSHAMLCTGRGQWAEAERLLEPLRDSPDVVQRRVVVPAIAELCLWRHDPESALALVQAELDHTMFAAERAYLLYWCLRALGDIAVVRRLRGQPAPQGSQAAELVDRFGRDFHDHGMTGLLAAEVAAEWARADALPAVTLWRRVTVLAEQWPSERAYAGLRLAEACLGEGVPGAEEALSRAWQTASALGARPLVEEIEALAARGSVVISVPTEAPAVRAPVALTPRECQVLDHLKRGLTNRRIGRALGISERTASVHVSNILGKLGVANRTAAAAVARNLGL
ncbi:ATP-binding protein [Cellulomonas sp. URHB0016]